MHKFGFSTGALALGDFRRALAWLAKLDVCAVELSALRENELPALMGSIADLDLSGFDYISVHAPSRFAEERESSIAEALAPCTDLGWPLILHPDAIRDHGCWRDFGKLLCLENMDKRKPSGRTVEELEEHFAKLPNAALCLDLGHARQVDPTFGVARRILSHFGDRLTQIHLSELDVRSRHRSLSMASVWAIQEIASLIPECTVILESAVAPDAIASELEMAHRCFVVANHSLAALEPASPAHP